MTVPTREVKARIFLRGILIVGGTLHRTNSELMFMANRRPGIFRTVRWSSPLSEVVAIRAIPAIAGRLRVYFVPDGWRYKQNTAGSSCG